MHLAEGQLKAYLDRELPSPHRERVKAHVASCQDCQRRLEELAAQAAWVGDRLTAVSPLPSSAPAPSPARARLQTRIQEK